MSKWFNEAIFYHIYPLGFCGAPKNNDYHSKPCPQILKVKEWISHIKDLGADAIYLGPIFESVSHGYDTVDYNKIDRRLGDNETFAELSQLLHSHGIKIVLDGVFNHVGRDFWAFKDILINGRNSKYCRWFENLCFEKSSPLGDNFSYDSWNGYYNLVKLDPKNHEVKNYLLDAVKSWITTYDIDGLRLDCADCLDFGFIRELKDLCTGMKPDFWLMGEVVHGHGDYRPWLSQGILDSVTNYECYKGLYSSHNDVNFFEIAFSLNRQFNNEYGLYRDFHLYSFVDNHDVNRIGSTLKNSSHLYTIYPILFTMPGIPSLYYGSEFGIGGRKVKGSDDELRPDIDLGAALSDKSGTALAANIKKLANIRKNSAALTYGRYEQLFVNHEQLAFARITEDECIIVVINSSKQAFGTELNIPFHGSRLSDLLNDGVHFTIMNGKSFIDCSYPCRARVLKVCK